MFKLSNKIKVFSIALLVLGAIGIVYGFLSTPSKADDVKDIVIQKEKAEQGLLHNAPVASYTQEAMEEAENADFVPSETKIQKTLHQLQARPWAATFVAAFFFFMIALGALVFHAVQYASEAGWSPVLYRVFEGITSYLLPGSIIVALLVLLAGTHFYPWQNAELVKEDEILQVKSLYLNYPFFIARMLIYLLIWNVYRYYQRKNSLAEVDPTDFSHARKNHDLAVYFLVFFGITESPMVWDWFMSMTPHWFSALYAWYIFASLFVTAITVIAMVTIMLKKHGYLEKVNDSHIHDLAKYMFAFSIFWTYFWFAQFMLIWYANIPEEASYFVLQIEHYKLLFFGMLVTNFVFPILILMDADFKRVSWIINLVGTFLLIGHYVTIYLVVIPSTVGTHGSFGVPEFGAILFFLGLFILVVGTALGKVPLEVKGNPYLKESENYQY